MNFFGHCVTAAWQSDRAGFALGAMLPDFASMCGARLGGAGSALIERGVAWHHVTDRAFHRAPEFRELNAELAGRLRRRGASRGGALGAAHVGLELLLDGLLLDDPAGAALYPEAIRAARADELGGFIHFATAEEASRFSLLQRRLERGGLPVGYRDLDEVSRRVTRVLAARPRLALDAAGEEALRRELPPAREALSASLSSLLARLRAELCA